VKSVDLLPIITEQINPQHQFTAIIQIPSHGLQVDVQLNNQKKKKKKKKRESIWGFRQEPSNRDQTSDFNGLGSRIDGGSVGGGQLERRGSVGGGHPDRRGSVGAPGSMGSVGGGQLDRRVSVGGGQLDRRGRWAVSTRIAMDFRSRFFRRFQADMASVAGWTWVGAGLIRPAGRGQWERPATRAFAGRWAAGAVVFCESSCCV
jgi:hypothetical protein